MQKCQKLYSYITLTLTLIIIDNVQKINKNAKKSIIHNPISTHVFMWPHHISIYPEYINKRNSYL
jgi:hypothetical protein